MAKSSYKTGPLSEMETFFILGNRDKGLDYLIKHTGRAPTAIEKLLADNPPAPVEAPVAPPEPAAPSLPKTGDLYARPNGQRNGGAIVMTQAAGEMADKTRKSVPIDTTGYIHKIRP